MQMHLQREILTYISRICKSCPHYLWNHRKKKNFSFLMFMFHIYELNCKSCFHVFLVIFYLAQSDTCSIIHRQMQCDLLEVSAKSLLVHFLLSSTLSTILMFCFIYTTNRLSPYKETGLDYKRYHLTYRITTYI